MAPSESYPASYSMWSVAPEIGPARTTRRRTSRRAVTLVAEIDPAARQVVRRHLDDHAVADAGADAKLAHLPRHVSEQLMVIVERDAVVAVRQHLGHGAIEFEQL